MDWRGGEGTGSTTSANTDVVINTYRSIPLDEHAHYAMHSQKKR
jgi:hypothetical protein